MSSEDIKCEPAVSPSDASDENRRRSERVNLTIPVEVTGWDQKRGEWKETAQTIDVSKNGVTFTLARRVGHGGVLHLKLALPTAFRQYGLSDAEYGVYSLVRRIEPLRKGARVVGLEFIGEEPPVGHAESPWATFKIDQWGGIERRRKPRRQVSDVVWLEYFSEAMHCIKQEVGRTEDVSKAGMRVQVLDPPPEFELVKVIYPNGNIEEFAVLRNRFSGDDGMERLCLRLIDKKELAEWSAGLEAAIRAERLAKSGPLVEKAALTLQRKKILVADDDATLRKVLSKILTGAGYEVINAEDGKAAFEKAAKERPDLVITDALMPKMHGFLVCQEIKRLQHPPKVVLLTAIYTNVNYKWEARNKYGADDLLTKPFEVTELLACIEKQLGEASHANVKPT